MTLSMNQFDMQPVQGDLSLPRTGTVITAAVSANENGVFVAGQAVKIDPAAPYGGVPQMLALTANTQESFGVVIRQLKNTQFSSGVPFELAMNNSVIWMTAAEAINPGQFVEFIYTTNKIKTNTGVNPYLGKALDKSTGDGSLIRVLLQVPLNESPSA